MSATSSNACAVPWPPEGEMACAESPIRHTLSVCHVGRSPGTAYGAHISISLVGLSSRSCTSVRIGSAVMWPHSRFSSACASPESRYSSHSPRVRSFVWINVAHWTVLLSAESWNARSEPACERKKAGKCST